MVLIKSSVVSFGNLGEIISFSGNFSISPGPTLGQPLFDGSSATVSPYGPSSGGYYVVGFGELFITRIDATMCNRFTFFVAGVLHRLKTFDIPTSLGIQPGERMVSGAITLGLGYNFKQKD